MAGQACGDGIGETRCARRPTSADFCRQAGDGAAQALGADVAAKVLVGNFRRRLAVRNENEAPVAAILGIELEHRMAERARTGEEIENEIAGTGCDTQDAFHQPQGLGRVKGGLRAEDRLNLFFRFVGMADFFVGPPCPGNEAFHFG